MLDADGRATGRPRRLSDFTIRPAAPEDAEALMSLIDALADYEHLPRPDGEARARLVEHAFGGERYFRALLAEADDRPVGYALYFFTYSSFVARPTLYLEDIFVLPELRGRGYGRALMRHLIAESVESGCGRMEWQVLDWNQPSIDFYERLGATRMREWLPYRLTREQLVELSAQQEGEGGP